MYLSQLWSKKSTIATLYYWTRPQNLMRDIYRWETFFSIRTKAFENLD